MSEPETILAAAQRLLAPAGRWQARTVVVPAGPTREHLDPVRVITNPSSGRGGIGLSGAAGTRGAEVIPIVGPTDLPLPSGVKAVRVETTADMQRAVQAVMKGADALIMAAAPADYRPLESAPTKRPRANGRISVQLEATPDILTSLKRPKGCVMVGFALELGDGLAKAQQKVQDKRLDFVVLNDAPEPGAGFAVATNKVDRKSVGVGKECRSRWSPDH